MSFTIQQRIQCTTLIISDAQNSDADGQSENVHARRFQNKNIFSPQAQAQRPESLPEVNILVGPSLDAVGVCMVYKMSRIVATVT